MASSVKKGERSSDSEDAWACLVSTARGQCLQDTRRMKRSEAQAELGGRRDPTRQGLERPGSIIQPQLCTECVNVIKMPW